MGDTNTKQAIENVLTGCHDQIDRIVDILLNKEESLHRYNEKVTQSIEALKEAARENEQRAAELDAKSVDLDNRAAIADARDVEIQEKLAFLQDVENNVFGNGEQVQPQVPEAYWIENDRLKKELEDAKNSNLDDVTRELQDEINALSEDITRKDEHIADLTEEIEQVKAASDEGAVSRIAELEEQLGEAEEKRDALTDENERLRLEINDLREYGAASATQASQIEELNARMREITDTNENLVAENNSLRRELQNASELISKMTAPVEDDVDDAEPEISMSGAYQNALTSGDIKYSQSGDTLVVRGASGITYTIHPEAGRLSAVKAIKRLNGRTKREIDQIRQMNPEAKVSASKTDVTLETSCTPDTVVMLITNAATDLEALK